MVGNQEEIMEHLAAPDVNDEARNLRVGRAAAESLPFVVASTLCVVAIAEHWIGTDLPAQIFRADLVRQHGFVIWNAMWYGGHPTLSYSVLTPLLSALVGPIAVCAISGVVSALLFQRMVEHAFGPAAWVGTVWFAAGTAVNLAVGRVAFALGLTFALAAIAGLQSRRDTLAAGFAAAAALASPVAAVAVAVAAIAVAYTTPNRRIRASAVAAAAVLPIGLIALVFPGSGHFPYRFGAFVLDLLMAALVWLAVRRRAPVVAVGVTIYAAIAVLAFFVPTPLGGNISRFGQFFAWPLLACALKGRARWLLVALAAPMLFWQWSPAVDAMTRAKEDPSTTRAYYQPLLDAVMPRLQPGGRLEIPFTLRHWETAYVAPDVPLARGWERQLDIKYNELFYDGTLTADNFHAWLTNNAVQFVALPDTSLDPSSEGEAALLRSGLPYLQAVWSDANWTLWQVTDFRGLVTGPAQVIDMNEDGVLLHVDAPGTLLVRVRPSPHWVATAPACVESDPSGWIRVEGARPGPLQLTQSLRGTPCS
jgi:hypothetical protein